MQHLMIDLETMGTRFDAPIIAVGAVFFDPMTGNTGERFLEAVDLADAFRFGKASGDTVKWWMEQSEAARKAAIRGTAQLGDVLGRFADFYRTGTKVAVWGNGATFDISILEYAFMRSLNKAPPWDFWMVRDCRTVKDLGSHLSVDTGPAVGVQHNALDDALNQVRWVSQMWAQLKRGGAAQVVVPTMASSDDLLG
jgi:hypothetical protein